MKTFDHKAWRRANRDKVRAADRRYRASHREKVRAGAKRRRLAKLEQYRAMERAASRRRKRDPEKVKQYRKTFWKKHKERLVIGHRVYEQLRRQARKRNRCAQVPDEMTALDFYRSHHLNGRAYVRRLIDPMIDAREWKPNVHRLKASVIGVWICRLDGRLMLVAERQLFPVIRFVADDEPMGHVIKRLDMDVRDQEMRA